MMTAICGIISHSDKLRKNQSMRNTRTTAAAFTTILLLLAAVFPAHAAPRQTNQEEPEWLVMLYQNADDEVLEGDIFTDLNEAEWVGSTDAVTIVAQLDRYDGAFDGDGDWTTAKRFLVTQDNDLSTLASEELDDLGEVDSGAPETLVDFAVWAMTNYPAQKYALILSDHGAGWVGGWNDDAPEEGSAEPSGRKPTSGPRISWKDAVSRASEADLTNCRSYSIRNGSPRSRRTCPSCRTPRRPVSWPTSA